MSTVNGRASDRTCDSGKLDAEVRDQYTETISPHRSSRVRQKTQDGRRLRRHERRLIIERSFAWIQWQWRLLVRWEYHPANFLGFVLSLALLAMAGAANAVTATLLAHNSRGASGTLSTLIWNGADGNPASTAAWDWNSSTGVLSMTGLYWATVHLFSNPAAPSIAGTEVYDLSIDTTAQITTAASFVCHEGTFLATVGANGCLNIDLGGNFVNESSALYNVGGNANCIVRTIGGDDISMGNPAGLTTAAAAGGCDAVAGLADLWTIVQDSGGVLILSNGLPLAAAGANYMTFSLDTDDDGVADASDNCTLLVNPAQCDSDGDDYGNRCDGDLNNNTTTNSQDYVLFRAQLSQPSVAPTYNQADINCNGTVNSQDYVLFRGLLGQPSGPSGLVP